MKKQFDKTYEDIVSLENLFAAWQGFMQGKRNKKDVQEFSRHLTDNIVQLHEELASFQYKHGAYKASRVADPKPRQIHKALVKDRVVHHAVYRQLYPFFDRLFIADSFSCRLQKGAHRARSRFVQVARQVSRNHTKTCWVMKCDIRKCFASIDHAILMDILAGSIPDLGIMLLLQEIIESFSVTPGTGLPLGNLTSQLFCNIYMNELDQFVKHKLRVANYVRYADDFVLLLDNRKLLAHQLFFISEFLSTKLKLHLHPNKVFLQTFSSGIDFLGWVHFPHYQIIRTTTKRRVLSRVQNNPTNPTLQSYLGLLKWGDTYQLTQDVVNLYGLYRVS